MRIKEIRAAKGISQRRVALDLGLSPVVYGRYENGSRKPEPEMLARIVAYLNVTVDELIGVNDKTIKHPTEVIQISLKNHTSSPRGAVFHVPSRAKVASAMITARGSGFRSNTPGEVQLGVIHPVKAEIDPLYARIHGLSSEDRQRVSDFIAGIEAKK